MPPLRYLVTMLTALLPAAAEAAWARAETAAFIGYSRGSAKDLHARLSELQAFDSVLNVVTGRRTPQFLAKVPVYFIAGRDLKLFGLSASNVAGFYTSTPGLTAAFAVTDREASVSHNANVVLFHEYVHHFMFRGSRAVHPAWYVEGFAEYLSTTTFSNRGATYGNFDRGRAYQLNSRSWLPMRRIFNARVPELRAAEIGLFYAQSWLVVHYLSRDPARRRQLQAYLQEINRGTTADVAFGRVFGVSYEKFGRDILRYTQSREFTMSRLSGDGVVMPGDSVVTVLPTLRPVADALLLPAARLATLAIDGGERGADAVVPSGKALLDMVRKAAARYPAEPFAQATLAEAEIKLGDRAAGIAMLDAQLAARPRDAQLLYLRGLTLVAEGAAAGDAAVAAATMRRARILLTRADTIQPDDYRILAAHARTYPIEAMPEAELDVLLKAAELAPQVAPNAILAARALLARGDREIARILLEPIANSPHGSSSTPEAAALLASIGRDGVVPGGADVVP